MEGSESEAVFESLNLKPQLFVNQVFNATHDLVETAFEFFHEEASTLLNTNGTDRAADLTKGVDYVRARVQDSLGPRIDVWERYCLNHCFVVPDSFVLPDKEEPVNEFTMDLNVLNDEQSDPELDILRNRLSQVGKESAELNRQLQILERQNNMSNHCATAVTESLKLYDQNVHDMFGEMMKTSVELHGKLEKLRAKQMEVNEQGKRKRVNGSTEDLSNLTSRKGLSNLNLDDLQRVVDAINKA